MLPFTGGLKEGFVKGASKGASSPLRLFFVFFFNIFDSEPRRWSMLICHPATPLEKILQGVSKFSGVVPSQ